MAFNGSSAQETSDQLFLALIHPQMPAYYVCANDTLWDRFLKTVIDYDKDRMDLAAPSARLPAVSGPRPFYMNLDGHTKYSIMFSLIGASTSSFTRIVCKPHRS